MDRDNVEYAIHLHCKEKASFMKVLDADSGIVFSSSSTCMKESDNQKKKKKKRRTDVDGDICKRRALGRGFSSDDCVFCFSRSRECVIELSFPEEREGERERESSACQCQLWCQHGSILLPPVMYIYTFFFLLLLLAPLSRPRQKAALHWGRERDGQS